MIAITMDNVLPLLKQAVDTKGPDYRYTDDHAAGISCQYRDPDGRPACLIGVVLDLVGFDLAVIVTCGLNASIISQLANANCLGLQLTDDVVAVLNEAQNQQDKRQTWGQAYEAAKRLHARLIGEKS